MWPQEHEALRDEARRITRAVTRYVQDGPEPPSYDDPHARVQFERKMMQRFETRSPAGADKSVGGVPCRVFRAPEPRGTYLHFHGGGMSLGSPLANDEGNAELCERHGVDVVSVDYRLAPEHPFPAGGDDCLAAAKALLARNDLPIVVGGESAGGYYAVLTLLRIRDELDAIDRVAGANLLFGVYDLSGTPTARGSRPSDADDMLDEHLIDFVLSCYLPGVSREEARDGRYSPLFADLSGMPPALFTAGSADHLLDDTLFLEARWRAWGNDTELAVYPDCPHGFTAFPMKFAELASSRVDAFLTRCFAAG